MWHYCIICRKSRVFETAPFVVIVNSKKLAAKGHKFQYIFSSRSVLFISCFKNAKKTSVLKKRVDFSKAISNFHFELNSVTS